jgi:hypothetical protein
MGENAPTSNMMGKVGNMCSYLYQMTSPLNAVQIILTLKECQRGYYSFLKHLVGWKQMKIINIFTLKIQTLIFSILFFIIIILLQQKVSREFYYFFSWILPDRWFQPWKI